MLNKTYCDPLFAVLFQAAPISLVKPSALWWMRKSGALSLFLLVLGSNVSAALKVSVSMVPVQPAPSLVNIPMIAITFSFVVVEVAHCVLA
jgi:hypothetical protein